LRKTQSLIDIIVAVNAFYFRKGFYLVVDIVPKAGNARIMVTRDILDYILFIYLFLA